MKTRAKLAATVLLSLTGALAQTTAVQGTNQLAGGDAQMGKTYTLYPGTEDAMNFTLNRAEYSVGHWLSSNKENLLPRAGQKLLILHATVQNPQKVEHFFRGDSYPLSGVDSKNTEVQPDWSWYDEKTHAPVEMNFKPAQKLDVIILMKLDGQVSLPKLIVNTSNNKVWRYDLRGKIAGLSAPFADPASKDGSAALDSIPAKAGTFYPSQFDLRLDKVEYTTQPTLGLDVPEEGRLMIVYATVRNPLPTPQIMQSWMVNPKVFDQDDLDIRASSNAKLVSRDLDISGELAPNKELAVRYVLPVAKGTEPRRLVMQFDEGRAFTFDLGALK